MQKVKLIIHNAVNAISKTPKDFLNMKIRYFFFIGFVALFLQCSKDSATDTASYTSTGQGGSLARFCIAGNYLYTVDAQYLKVYDISNGQQPVLKNNTAIGFEIETIYPFGDKLFIGSTSVVYIFSIANPQHPTQLGTAISPNVIRRCDPVVAKDTVAFATLRTNGACGGQSSILAVFDIKDVTQPVQKATFQLTEPYGLGYADSVLYVCDAGLKVINIANPYQPVLIKTLNNSSHFKDVICYQNTLICWVADGAILYDITDRTDPVYLAKII